MDAPVKEIFCISGLGADEKVFEHLHINGYSLVHLNYISPMKNESLSSYAMRMAEKITDKNPVILGLSFGGMVAIEMAKQMPVGKLILVSAPKTYFEVPRWMRLAGSLQLHKIIPIKTNRFTEKADDKRMGIRTPEEKAMVEAYRKSADQVQVTWAIDQVLKWRNTWIPEKFYHIHGAHDRMFPVKNLKPTHLIEEGSHIMILNKAKEISLCIEEILNS